MRREQEARLLVVPTVSQSWRDGLGTARMRGLCGAVAQLGERRVRNAKVRGSIPLSSTTSKGPDRLRALTFLSEIRALREIGPATARPVVSHSSLGPGSTSRYPRDCAIRCARPARHGFHALRPRPQSARHARLATMRRPAAASHLRDPADGASERFPRWSWAGCRRASMRSRLVGRRAARSG